MSNVSKIRSLNKLQLVREHERNLAAANKVLVEGRWRTCRDRLAEERERYAQAMTTIGARLGAAGSVGEVDQIRDELSATRNLMLLAQQQEVDHKLQLDEANKELARCEQALRTADRMLEQAESEQAAELRRAEQAELDDLVAASRRLSA